MANLCLLEARAILCILVGKFYRQKGFLLRIVRRCFVDVFGSCVLFLFISLKNLMGLSFLRGCPVDEMCVGLEGFVSSVGVQCDDFDIAKTD